jgi:cytochrome b subunit of formate dehydrogenase
VLTGVVFLAAAPTLWEAVTNAAESEAAGPKAAEPAAKDAPATQLPSELCLGCHGNPGFEAPGSDGQMRSLSVARERFEKSVHGKRLCVECHKNMTEIPHQKGVEIKVSCVQCHEALWDAAKKENKTQEHARLGVVVEQIEHYMRSIHARPSREDQSRTNATCYNCHDAHYVYPKGSPERTEWRLSVPNACGKCHAKEREQYATSVHGKAVLEQGNAYAAICADCHTTHDVEDPAKDSTKVAITRNCGNCHSDSLKSYTETYHGQVNRLGYAHTAKCFDCHGSHAIQRVEDPKSTVHKDNRLQTCQKCHKEATKGFVTFEPHGTSDDFGRYPYIWIASKFMLQLLAGTFAFFWTHTALWFYREYKDRQQRKMRPHVLAEAIPEAKGKYYQRFPLIWRIAHLTFALSLMILTLTGMSVFYADTAWAPVVMNALGGPIAAAYIHRVSAVIFATVFVAQLIYFVIRIGKNWRTFDWFGPHSLVPRLQDLWDIIAMFKWFFAMGPRPVFDRWTYWEKFDYWAPFWGVTIIGASGVMLWFPNVTASVLPGWVFNVATIFHGEEALLAALFLFTVHFFNNHFRPDKFPLDIVMFTGAVPLEEFRHEHTVEYSRLVKSGELAKYLVDAPSAPMTLGSKILGFTLIFFGLMLLVFVLTGVLGDLSAA